MNYAIWISAASAVIAALGAWLVFFRLRADHELSRRTQTLELMTFFYHVAREDHLLMPCIRLADSLNKTELDSLLQGREIEIGGEARKTAAMIAASKGFLYEDTIGSVKLGTEASYYIRQQIYSYLNALEILATAWTDALIDGPTFDREFRSVFLPASGKPPLLDFIDRSGIFPAVRAAQLHFLPDSEAKKRAQIA